MFDMKKEKTTTVDQLVIGRSYYMVCATGVNRREIYEYVCVTFNGNRGFIKHDAFAKYPDYHEYTPGSIASAKFVEVTDKVNIKYDFTINKED